MKALVAHVLATRVSDGDVVGLGSGSTAELALDQIGQRITREKLSVKGVPTSHRTAIVAAQAGVEVLSAVTDIEISWAFDGADEVDPDFNMIKGRGGAMLMEKIIAKRAKQLMIIVSEDKLVERLGTRHPVPVEIIPSAQQYVRSQLRALGSREAELRNAVNKYGPEITEHNHLIIDAWFDTIAPGLEEKIKCITGVVECGLFTGLNQELLIAKAGGVWSRKLVGGSYKEELVKST